MVRNYLLIAFCSLVLFNSCSGGSGGGSTGNIAQESSGAAVAATFGGMSSEGSLNKEASIPKKALDLLIKKAVAQSSFTACDAVEQMSGPSGITMGTSEEECSYSADDEDCYFGNGEDELIIDGSSADKKFCADDGLVAVWEIAAGNEVTMTCSDDEGDFTITMTGAGIFREDDNTTVIRGEFTMTSERDDETETFTSECSFDINHDTEAFAGKGCENAESEASEDIECEDPGEEAAGSGECQGSESGFSCETATDCTDCVPGSTADCEDEICVFTCTTDADCEVVEDAIGRTTACEEGHCMPQ